MEKIALLIALVLSTTARLEAQKAAVFSTCQEVQQPEEIDYCLSLKVVSFEGYPNSTNS